jgi:NAD+ synthase (glutamine-hydrolysing)
LENDTYLHCDQSLASIIDSDLTDNILCDIGCPIIHQNVRYNCRVFILNRKIVLIRPKMFLADDGNYRERRWFTAWKYDHLYENNLVEHTLSDILRSVTKQKTVSFGVAAIETSETLIASEICEELWAPDSPHVNLYLAGVEIISNGSASHHQLGKLQSRLNLIQSASSKCGGVYMYANQQGCDGNRLYFDGASLIYINGVLVAQATQFSLKDVEVQIAVVDLDDVRSYRGKSSSVQEQSSHRLRVPVLRLADMTNIYPIDQFPDTFSLSSENNCLNAFSSMSMVNSINRLMNTSKFVFFSRFNVFL